MSDTLNVHICTRDRPESLGVLLATLPQLVESPLRIFVYDDSLRVMAQSFNRRAVAQTSCPSVYVNEIVRRRWLRDVPWPSAAAAKFPDYAFKTLAQPGWDAAGVRGFAHFTAACTAGDGDRVLFLDDDIRLGTSGIKPVLSTPLKPGEIVGVGFNGRPDAYLVEHLAGFYRIPAGQADWTSAGTDLAGFVPMIADPRSVQSNLLPQLDIACGGGFLLMRGADVRAVPIPHCYNEDVIFLTGLLADPQRALRISGRVEHTSASELVRPTLAMARMQLIGFGVQRGIQMAYQRFGTDDLGILPEVAIQHCDQLMPVMEAKWQELLDRGRFTPWNDLDETSIRQLLDDPPRAEAREVITEYFGQWPGWHQAVGSSAVREHIQHAALQQLDRSRSHTQAEQTMVVGLPPAPPVGRGASSQDPAVQPSVRRTTQRTKGTGRKAE